MVFNIDVSTVSGSATATGETWNPLDSPTLKKSPWLPITPANGATTILDAAKLSNPADKLAFHQTNTKLYPNTMKAALRDCGHDKTRNQPQLVKGGLSLLFESESRTGSMTASIGGSDVESHTGECGGVGNKKQRNRSRKKNAKGSRKTALVAMMTQAQSQVNQVGVGAPVSAGSTRLSPSTQNRHPIPSPATLQPILFSKLPASAYSSQAASSASSDICESDATTPFSRSPSSIAGANHLRKGMLGELLEKYNSRARDIIIVTDENGHQETYEVALENDFISGDVRSRPGTRSGLNEALGPPSVGPGGVQNILLQQPHRRVMCAADFEVLTCLGKGAYGTVLLVRHIATGKLYAQKQLKKASLVTTKKLVEQTMTERQILEAVQHPFIVKLYYAFQDHQKLYLILEYAQGGELFKYLAAERMFSEDTVAFYMASLVLALAHLHKNAGVVYRDLKPENCLLDHEGYLLLTDFGLSKVALPGQGESSGSRCTSWVGTVDYMAPEIIQGKEYDEKVDWWSLGALGVDLLTGSPPFPGNNRARIQENIVKKKLVMPYYLSPDAKDILNKLLQKNPVKRWGVEDVPRMKKHRFFRKIDWERLENRDAQGGPPIRPLVTDPELAENFSSEFTALPCSPPVRGGEDEGLTGVVERIEKEAELFGGFSFVGSWVESMNWRGGAGEGDPMHEEWRTEEVIEM